MKKIISIVLTIILLLGMVACGAKETTKPEPQKNEETKPVEVAEEKEEKATEQEEPIDEEKKNVVSLNIGDTIDNDYFTMTFQSVEILDEYTLPTGNSSSLSPYVEEGYKLLLVEGHFENKSTSTISDSTFYKKAVVNGTFEKDGYDIMMDFARSKYFEIDPYTDYDYILYLCIPEKLAAQFETVTFTLGFNSDLSVPTTVLSENGKTVETEIVYEITGVK